MKFGKRYQAVVATIHRIGQWMRRLKWPDLDVRDMHVYPGLAIATAGGLILSVAWTLVTLGLFLALMGIFLPKGVR